MECRERIASRDRKRLAIFSTHAIQYHSPLYRELATRSDLDLTVYYAHRATAQDQASAGFGVSFEWDIPLLEGYRYEFLKNESSTPRLSTYAGCDTPEVAELIRRERFDAVLVHGWYTKSYRQTMRACWRTKTPLFIRGDSTLLVTTGWWRRLAKQIARRRFVPYFDAYLVVGQRAKEYYHSFGANGERMVSCPHFIDNERFARSATELRNDRTGLRKTFDLPENAIVFLFAGKFIEKKRPLDFIRAIKSIRTIANPVYGLFVGDGPMRPEIERMIAATNAPIRLAGFLNQTEIPKSYAVADVLVLPSDGTETWGLVVNEAMACGLPAIVSDRVGCGPDLITPGETGFIFPMGDVSKLAEQMKKFVDSSDLLVQMSRKAKERIANFSVVAAADGVCSAVERFGRKQTGPSQ